MSLRITDAGLNRQMLADLQRTQTTIAETQLQIGSGTRVNKPSDDPGAIARLVDIEATQGRIDQYSRNADAAESRLVLEETALSSTRLLTLATRRVSTCLQVVRAVFGRLHPVVPTSGVATRWHASYPLP